MTKPLNPDWRASLSSTPDVFEPREGDVYKSKRSNDRVVILSVTTFNNVTYESLDVLLGAPRRCSMRSFKRSFTFVRPGK